MTDDLYKFIESISEYITFLSDNMKKEHCNNLDELGDIKTVFREGYEKGYIDALKEVYEWVEDVYIEIAETESGLTPV